MNGNQFILSKNGVAVAAIVSHEAETQADKIEVASKTQGQYREYMAGRKRWEISANYLVVSSDMILAMIQTGQTFAIKSYNRDNELNNVHGQATLQQCRITATRGKLITGFFKFIGSEDLWYQMTRGDFNFDFNSDFLI